MKIKANGASINYEIQGKGEDLVLIHGAGDSLRMWYHQLPVFSKKYRVITPDMRGHGQTESPSGDFTVELMAEDVYGLMKAIRVEIAGFLGYSMGGRVAAHLAVNHPEMVRALVLANSAVGLTAPAPEAAERRRKNIEMLEGGDIKTVAETMTTGAFSPGFRDRNPAEFERYRKIKAENRPAGIAGVMRAMQSATRPPDLSRLKCPTLIIVGEHDSYMTVEQGKLTQQAIAGSKLVVFPTGHAAAIELPDRFNAAVLDFLAGVRAKPPG